MSLSNPRIPKGKVTLSDVKMELFYLDDIEETEEVESPYSKELEQLESHQKNWKNTYLPSKSNSKN